MKKIIIICLAFSACKAFERKTDMKHENLHPKIIIEKIKGHKDHLKQYQFTIDTIHN